MDKIKRKKIIRVIEITVIAVILLAIFIPEIIPVKAPDGLGQYLASIEDIHIPGQARIVGLGEATHGNKEFWDVRQTVLSELVKDGFNVVVLEADFGGCLVANEYVINGKGTAENAAKALGFAVYRTEETAGFLHWIHDYNETVLPEQAVRFMGCDMQRYDNNKEGLFRYLRQVSPGQAEEYEQLLADLNDETVFNQDKGKIKQGLEDIQTLLADMERNREAYITATSESEYELAYAYGNTIQENAILRGTDVNYSATRDKYMAEKLHWIDQYESSMRESKLLLLAHNGHVEKTSASGYRCLGDYLAEQYSEEYFAIGTEYSESAFLCKDSSGNRKEFHVKNGRSSRLASMLGSITEGPVYFDFASASDDAKITGLLSESTRMSNIGDEFNGMLGFLPQARTLMMIPNESYDALVYIKMATPTTMLN